MGLWSLLATLVVVAVWFGWREIYLPLQVLTRAQAEAGRDLAAQAAAIDALRSDLDRQLGGLNSRTSQRDREFDRWRQNLDQSLSGMRRYLGQTRRDWLALEAEHLMTIASHKLVLARDVATAVRALEYADASLNEMNDPAWLPVRETLRAEIQALRAVPRPDLVGLDLAISALAHGVSELPLAEQVRGHPETLDRALTPATGWWGRLKAAVRGIITVRREVALPMPLLPPRQRYFLTLNLELQLAAARLDLRDGDQPRFRRRLAQIRAWLDRYFDGSAASVVAAGQLLHDWEAVELGGELPDIGGSLRQARQLLAANASSETQ